MKKVIIAVLFFIFGVGIDSALAQSRLQDSLALVELYDSTSGDGWTNHSGWKTGNLNTWYGVTMAGGRVGELELINNNLAGIIPSSIGNINRLTYLNLSVNKITGSISTQIGNLTYLTLLYLTDNQLTGSIPAQIGNLTSLEGLFLGDNQFTGTIPPEIGNLENLTILYLGINQLTGSIPSEIGSLANLSSLYLSDNQLTDTVPGEIWNLTGLSYLFLGDNQLAGTISPEIGNLTNLEGLGLEYNQFTGSIPSEIGSLTNLRQLYLYSNQLTGTIPPEIGDLVNLKQMVLSSNQLNGVIPPEVENLTNLEEVLLSYNQLTDSIPYGIRKLTKLRQLYLSHNKFTELPSLSSLSSLSDLQIQNNKFTFEDIEPNVGVSSDIFYYSPQDDVGSVQNYTIDEDSSLTISVSVGGDHNQYRWGKDGIIIPFATDTFYTIDSATIYDAGVYTCRITNTVATGLALFSRPITVNVNPAAVPDTDIPETYSISVKTVISNSRLEIRYALPKKALVRFKIYNINGTKVEALSEENSAGFHSRKIDMRGRPRGVYFLKIEANEFTETKKVVLM